MTDANVTSRVRAQYESLPYPPRNPEDERHRLLSTYGDSFVRLSHHCFGGKLDVTRGFRCLVAGGGTGDSTIFLAEQLRQFPGEVVYLDLSEASQAVAQARAEVRGLNNIQWLSGSLLDLGGMDLEPFDYISCTGVLHHLASPEDGLKSLAAVLKPEGSMLLMLYGKYGRRPVYDMQALLRRFLPADDSSADKVARVRTLLSSLPKTNWFIRDMANWQEEMSAQGNGDAGLYDLLLHSQDQAYDVPGIHTLAAAAGLQLQGFPYRPERYDPFFLTQDESLDALLEQLTRTEQQAIAELMRCDISRHIFYVGRNESSGTQLSDAGLAPVLHGELMGKQQALADDLAGGGVVHLTINDITVSVQGGPIISELVARMNGDESVQNIIEAVQGIRAEADIAEIRGQLEGLYEILNDLGLCYLTVPGALGSLIPSAVQN